MGSPGETSLDLQGMHGFPHPGISVFFASPQIDNSFQKFNYSQFCYNTCFENIIFWFQPDVYIRGISEYDENFEFASV